MEKYANEAESLKSKVSELTELNKTIDFEWDKKYNGLKSHLMDENKTLKEENSQMIVDLKDDH